MERIKFSTLFIFTILLTISGCRKDDEPNTPKAQALRADLSTTNIMEMSSLQRELKFATDTNLLSAAHRPDYSSNEPYYVQHSFTESLLSAINPESLKKYEGSYSGKELRSGNDDPSVYKLKSSWVTGSNAPSVGIHIERNPATGQYEVSGGELYLPKSGFGFGYNENRTSGESQTFLNWKREF